MCWKDVMDSWVGGCLRFCFIKGCAGRGLTCNVRDDGFRLGDGSSEGNE